MDQGMDRVQYRPQKVSQAQRAVHIGDRRSPFEPHGSMEEVEKYGQDW